MRIFYEFLDGPRPCNYLPEQQAVLLYEYVKDLKPEEYEALMSQRVRKFANALFRPICPNCDACRPIRVVVDRFKADRSMKRCLKLNQDLRIEIRAAQADRERVALYNQYHDSKISEKSWNPSDIDLNGYQQSFLSSDILIEEVAVYVNQQLIGILLFEELPKGISLIYHFYDPNFSDRGLGNFLILKAIELAKQRDKEFVYLGYFVDGSQSMNYKAKFRENQLLIDGEWR